jgi:phosphoenolpyruvate carboxylase
LRYALERQSALAMEFYETEVRQLRRELSQSLRLVQVTPALEQLAQCSAERSEHRRDEPYRLALSHLHDRLVATNPVSPDGGNAVPMERPVAPYKNSEAFAAHLQTIAESLQQHGSARVARGRLRHLQRAVAIFGFHLAPLDLRQHSGVHERVVAELFRTDAGREGYANLPEAERRNWLIDALVMPRRLRSSQQVYSSETAAELKIFDTAARQVDSFTRVASASDNALTWDPGNRPSGLYLARIEVPGQVVTKPFAILR